MNAPDHSAPETRAHTGRSPYVVLAASILGISFAAPLIRLSTSPALVIAAWRLGLSLIMISAMLLVTGQWRQWRHLDRRTATFAIGGGVLLALHFWSWNASLQYTTVAASVTLVNLQPVIVAIVSAKWLGERATKSQQVGIAIAVFGALVVGTADVPGGISGIGDMFAGTAADDGGGRARALFGDVLAAVGAVTAALYFLIGRRVRRTLALWSYVGLAYGSAFASCVMLALASGDALFPTAAREYAIFAGLAIGPMLLGHTGMNWALGHLPAYVVSLTTLGEPIGATVLAALLPGIAEIPGWGTVFGAVFILGGVLLAVRRR